MSKQISLFKIEGLRLRVSICIMRSCIWSTNIFVDNVKIILTWLMPQTLNAFSLQLCFFAIKSTSTSNSIKLKLNIIILFLLLRTSWRPFSSKVLENLPCLWPISRQRLSKILNTNIKKYNIKFYTYSTSNLFLWNLTSSAFLPKTCCMNTYTKLWAIN